MITVKQLIEFLKDYKEDAEVILPDGSEIKHVGMARINKGKYCVILANNQKNRIE